MELSKVHRRVATNAPKSLSDISTDWLNTALGDHLSAKIVGMSMEPIDAGFYGSLARVDVSYEEPGSGPRSFVAKFAAEDLSVREALRPLGIYEREYNFYTTFEEQMPIRIPHCYFAYYDGELQDSFLLLEWLEGEVFDDLGGTTIEAAQCAFGGAARMHSHWRGSPALQMGWIQPFCDSPVREGLMSATAAALPRGLELVRDYCPGWMVDNGLKAPEIIGLQLAELNTLPHTLVHLDYRLPNMVFSNQGTRTSMALIDWQSILRAPGVCDLGFFSFMSLSVSERREWENELVADYLSATEEWSGTEWPEWFEKAWGRMALLCAFNCLRNATVLDLTDEKTRVLMAAWIERACAAAEDHGALKYMDA